MAFYFGINNGQNEYEAVSDTSSPSKDVEIKIETPTINSVQDLRIALEKLENFILRAGKVW